jgi:hypothetical protein
MPKGKNQHVVRRGKGWAVKSAGSKRASSTHRKQSAAIRAGKRAAKSKRSELYVHGRDGRIREANSYGKDPHPPRG